MKQALALVLAGSTLAIAADATAGIAPVTVHPAGVAAPADPSATITLIDDDGEEGGWFQSNGGGSDDGNGGGSDSDDCNPETDPVCAAGNAAPAGTVAPPKNGLFTDGTAPVVNSN